jgi:hypothetical protein
LAITVKLINLKFVAENCPALIEIQREMRGRLANVSASWGIAREGLISQCRYQKQFQHEADEEEQAAGRCGSILSFSGNR